MPVCVRNMRILRFPTHTHTHTVASSEVCKHINLLISCAPHRRNNRTSRDKQSSCCTFSLFRKREKANTSTHALSHSITYFLVPHSQAQQQLHQMRPAILPHLRRGKAKATSLSLLSKAVQLKRKQEGLKSCCVLHALQMLRQVLQQKWLQQLLLLSRHCAKQVRDIMRGESVSASKEIGGSSSSCECRAGIAQSRCVFVCLF